MTKLQMQISQFVNSGVAFKSIAQLWKSFNQANNLNTSYLYFSYQYKRLSTPTSNLTKAEPLVKTGEVSPIGFICDNPIIDPPKAITRNSSRFKI